MSMPDALRQMKSVRQPSTPRGLRRIRGRSGNRGFSLMELMIAVVIIGVLMAMGVPIYKEYLIRANQAAAKAVLLEVASRQEQYLIKAGAYSASYTATGCVFGELSYTAPVDVCGRFDFALTAGTLPTTYSVDAMRGLPTFLVSASGKAGTMQAGFPAAGATTEYSINQFGLKLPVSAW
jgi:type IV pilus assembly protein PilE